MHGYGEMTYEDARVYRGEFFNDKKHGFGIFTWPNGKIYEGNFVNGKQNGKAIITIPNQTVRETLWENGKCIKWLKEELGNWNKSNNSNPDQNQIATTPKTNIQIEDSNTGNLGTN